MPSLKRHTDYRSFPWYFVVFFGFLISVIIFSIIYFIVKKCKYLPYWSTIFNTKRESLQNIKEFDIQDDETLDYCKGNISLKESSSIFLKNKSHPNKRCSLLFSLKPNNNKSKKKNSLLKSTIDGKTNNSLASHCTTITTISASESTTLEKKKDENIKKLSPKKTKILENTEDCELTVIDPLLSKQYTGKIFISESSIKN